MSEIIPTVKVAHEGGYKIINTSDYDPKVDKLYDEAAAEAKAAAEAEAAAKAEAEAKAQASKTTSRK